MIEFRTIEPVTSILRRDLVSPNMLEIVDNWIAPPTAPGLVVFGERHDRWTMADPEWTSHAGPLGLGRFRPTRGAPPRCL